MWSLLKTPMKIFREEGALALLNESIGMSNSPHCLREMRNLHRGHSIDSLATCGLTKYHGLIRPVQDQSEISKLLMIPGEVEPKSILEIGTAGGGALFFVSRLASDDACIISINLPGGWLVSGDGPPGWKIPLYKALVPPNQRVHLIRRDSHDEKTLEQVEAILNGEKVDFSFMDADNTY